MSDASIEIQPNPGSEPLLEKVEWHSQDEIAPPLELWHALEGSSGIDPDTADESQVSVDRPPPITRSVHLSSDAGQAAEAPPTPLPPATTAEAGAAAKIASAVGYTGRRAAAAVKGSIVPRVERVRDRSVVMLEDAPDDSGLRFVLIAAFLFVFFIFLFVLSTVIK